MIMAEKEYWVGVNYFSGWWREEPHKYAVKRQPDWRLRYPERIPALGCYNDQETMDAEIRAAGAHGVDFFMMLWYVNAPPRHAHGERLNAGLRQFMASGDSWRMRFCIECCNTDPFGIAEDALWEESCREWTAAMRHPSYLRVGGKAVFKFISLQALFEQSGRDAGKLRRRIDRLRDIAEREQAGPLLIGAGLVQQEAEDPVRCELAQMFDFAGTYMDLPGYPQRPEADYDYEALLGYASDSWERIAGRIGIPYVPYVPAGWNPKPWLDRRASFSLPDVRQWKEALMTVRRAMDRNPALRLPDGTKDGRKMCTVYAWNEFGEGGIVAPTLGDGRMKLEGIREIFTQ